MSLAQEIVGYAASGLVLLTFTTKHMRPLRLLAILSNIAFISYGILDDIAPVLSLHLILLPLNIFRLLQLKHRRCYTWQTHAPDIGCPRIANAVTSSGVWAEAASPARSASA